MTQVDNEFEPQSELLNMESLEDSTGEDPELMQELVEVFAEDSLEYFEDLVVKIAVEDIDQIKHLVHTLKGSSAQIGADRIREVSAEIEKHVQGGHLESASSLVPLLRVEIDSFAHYVKDLKFE